MVETTYGNGIAGLQANPCDLSFALDGTVQRGPVVDFVPQPIFMYDTALLARAEMDIQTWKAINESRLQIGVPVDTTMETEIMRRAPDPKLERFQNINEKIAAFQAGRLPAIASALTGKTLAFPIRSSPCPARRLPCEQVEGDLAVCTYQHRMTAADRQ